MIIKTVDLTGSALDWAAAKAEGFTANQAWTQGKVALWKGKACKYSPSTDWSLGGLIIEMEEISLCREFSSGKMEWAAWTPAPIRDDAEAFGYGPTPLIAAMRAFVASKLGDEIEVPNELTGE